METLDRWYLPVAKQSETPYVVSNDKPPVFRGLTLNFFELGSVNYIDRKIKSFYAKEQF